MKTHRLHQTILGLAFSLLAGVALFALLAPNAAAANNCPLTLDEPADVFKYAHEGTLEFSNFTKQDGQATITVTNNSDCQLPLALGSYQMMSGNQLSKQKLHDEQTKTVPAQETHTLTVDLPSCMAQIDLYHDPNQDGVPTPPEPANPSLIGFTFSGNEKDVFAENDIFHFDSDSKFSDLDNFPNDEDDGFRNAEPADDSRYCDVEPETCPYPNDRLPVEEPADVFEYIDEGTLKFSEFQNKNGKAAISITNNSNCQFPVSLGVYKMFDNSFENQELHSEDKTVVESDSQETVSAKLPACMAQIDLLYDPNQDGPPETPSSANPNVIGFTFHQNEEDVFAENDIFHFDDGHTYEDLDDFPNDEDDSPRDAGPSENFCPADSPTTKLTIKKKVSNKGGRNINPSDFDITATPHTGNSPAFLFNGSSGGETREVNAIRYNLSESGPDNVDFTTTYSGDCQARTDGSGGTVTPQKDETAVCTITNKLKDSESPNPLSGSCNGSPNTPETGEVVTWSSSASGGTGNYSYNWSGAAEGNDNSVTKTYNQTGTKTATVTISDGDSTIERSCSVNVRDDDDDNGGGDGGSGGGGAVLDPRDDDDDGEVRGTQDEEFSVQCQPEKDSYLIGEQATFTADIDGDIDKDDVTFNWGNTSNLTSDNSEATAQYVSAGVKSFEVTAEYEDEVETDTCKASIRRADNRSGVRLDELPYTGPSDTARTVGFGLLLLAFAIAGSYFGLRKLRKEEVPVGIPQDSKRQ